MPLNFPDTPANNEIYTYNGSSFIYTGSYWESLSYPSNIYSRNKFTATSGQTDFTVSYTVGYVDVWLNGLKLIDTDDYTANNGTSIILATGANANDDVEIVSWLPSSTQNGYYIDTVFNGTFANSTFTGNSYFANTVTVQAISANGSVGTNGQVLASNGTIAYWANNDGILPVGGANGHILAKASATDYDAEWINRGEELVGTVTGTTLDLSTGTVFSHAPSTNPTYVFDSPPASGTAYGFTLKVTPSATVTITWPASVDWPAGTAPTAPASGETDVFVFYTQDGGTTYYGFVAGDAMA